jgi:DNA-binding transcriptional LysR family regulator
MDQEIELRHLRYFVAVAEELHFGRAALRLHLAQPPLSQQIRKLEEIIGHRLFTRTSRAVRLTAAGEVLLDRARRTLRTVREDMAEVRSVGRGEIGSLRVGFIGSGMLTPLPAMLGRYRRKHPKADLQLREAMSSQIMQWLLDGAVDVGFLRDGGPLPGLESETLFSEPFVAVLPANHCLASRKSISGATLREEPFVFFPQIRRPVGLRQADLNLRRSWLPPPHRARGAAVAYRDAAGGRGPWRKHCPSLRGKDRRARRGLRTPEPCPRSEQHRARVALRRRPHRRDHVS